MAQLVEEVRVGGGRHYALIEQFHFWPVGMLEQQWATTRL